jgi:hypothetical protein
MAGISFKLQLVSTHQFLGTRQKGYKSEIITSGISRLVTLVLYQRCVISDLASQYAVSDVPSGKPIVTRVLCFGRVKKLRNKNKNKKNTDRFTRTG